MPRLEISGKGRPLLEDRGRAILSLITPKTSKGDAYYCFSEKVSRVNLLNEG